MRGGVLASAGSAVAMSLLLQSSAATMPYPATLAFQSAAAVGDYLGYSSPEYVAASRYFQGLDGALDAPSEMLISAVPTTDRFAFLRCGQITASFSDWLASLTTAGGAFAINIEAHAATGTVNPATVTSFSDFASDLQSAIGGGYATVAWNSTEKCFVITSAGHGSIAADASSVDFMTGAMADVMKASQATGAMQSDGVLAMSISERLTEITQAVRSFSVLMTAFEPDLAGKQDFATWVNSQGYRYLAVIWDTSTAPQTANNSASFAGWCKANGIAGVLPVNGDLEHAMIPASGAASLNFARAGGASDVYLQSQSSLTPYITDDGIYANLLTNGCSAYVQWDAPNSQGSVNSFSRADISGPYKSFKDYTCQIWLRESLKAAGVQAISAAGGVIPQSVAGQSYLRGCFGSVLAQAKAFGAIVAGVQLSDAETTKIERVLGKGSAAVIVSTGWFLKFDDPTDASKAAQTMSGVLYYQTGGEVKSLTLSAIAIT